MSAFPKRTWIEIDLDALAANYRTACALAAPCARVIPVLKANAYGHGAVRVAQRLAREGADFFAVSSVREGLQLRRTGISGTILVMSIAEDALIRDALAAKLTLTIGDERDAEAIARVAESLGEPADVHLKIDCGFHRLGLPVSAPDTPDRVAAMFVKPYLLMQGIFSHLSLRSARDDDAQAASLHALMKTLQELRCAPPMLHLVDSIGLVRYPAYRHDAARVGALLYGQRPAKSEGLPFTLLPTLALKTTIARVHTADAGDCIGYDEGHPLARRTRVATLQVGYGDGYPRAMGGTAEGSVRGLRARVLGLVCMDQIMVDVTDIPDAAVGDEVTLLGGDISLDQYAAWAGTNRNEALARLSARPLRVYLEQGRVAFWDDALLS